MSTDNKDAVQVAFELAAPNYKINIERTSKKAQALGIDGYKYEYATQMFNLFSDAYQAAHVAQAERIKQLEHEIWCAGVNADGALEKSAERIAELELLVDQSKNDYDTICAELQDALSQPVQQPAAVPDLSAAIMALRCDASVVATESQYIYGLGFEAARKSTAALVASARLGSARPSAAPARELTDADIDNHLDQVMRASGSALKYFSMPKTIEGMRAAMRDAMCHLTGNAGAGGA